MEKMLEQLNKPDFPFEWADLEYYPNSDAVKKEIYILNDENLIEELILLFHSLFGSRKAQLIIYDKSWWDFCLSTWNPNNNQYDYTLETKTEECQAYLAMLISSEIESGYSGSCKCKNWDEYLPVILRCIGSHQAPYSPLFCDVENKFFFYFHYSGSIGFYYKESNETIENILKKAHDDFRVVS